MLSAKELILRYERMFQKMIDDDRLFDDQQMREFRKIIEKQFGHSQYSNNFYKWKNAPKERSLIFDGELVDDGKTDIEIKNNMINLKATFKNSSKNSVSKRFVQVKIPVPRDCDETKVSFIRNKNSLIIKFPKNNSIPVKKKRFPLKKSSSETTI
jgi:hypothetical protein